MTVALLNNCRFECLSAGLFDFLDGPAATGFRNLLDASAVDGGTYPYRAESADKSEWENGFGTYDLGGGLLQRATVLQSSNAGAKVDFVDPPTVFVTLLAEAVTLGASRNVLGGAGAPMVEGDYTLGEVDAADCAANSATLQAIADSGETWWLPDHNPTYSFDRRILWNTDYSRLLGVGALVLPEDFFDNVSVSVGYDSGERYGPNAVGFLVRGVGRLIKGVEFRGWRMAVQKSDRSTDVRFMVGILAVNVEDFIGDVTVDGVALGFGLGIASAFGRTRISSTVQNMGSDADPGYTPACTGIAVDSDLGDAGASIDLLIEKCLVQDILLGGASLALYGQQGDTIKNNCLTTKRLKVFDCVLLRGGQGIDSYGQDAKYGRNHIEDMENFGIAFKYGAVDSEVFECTIVRPGLGGIGAFSGGADIESLNWHNNTIREINPLNHWLQSAGLIVSDGPGQKVTKCINKNNTIDLTAGHPAMAIFEDLDNGTSWSNDHGPNKIIGAGSFLPIFAATRGPSRFAVSDPTIVRARQTGSPTIAVSASFTTVVFAIEDYDKRGELASNTLTVTVPGFYRVRCHGNYIAVPAGVLAELGVLLGGSLRPGECAPTNPSSGGTTTIMPMDVEIVEYFYPGDEITIGTRHSHSSGLVFQDAVLMIEAVQELY